MTRRRSRSAPAADASVQDANVSLSETPDAHRERSEGRSAREYVNLPYQIAVRAEERGGGWTAHVEELPGCEAHGETPEKATRQLRRAMEAWISETLEKGEDVPEPRVLSGHSGRLLLRMPQSLHAELAHAADAEGVSLNQFITTALASAVGWRNHPAAGFPRHGDIADETNSGAAVARKGGSPRRSRGRNVVLLVNLAILLVLAALAVLLLISAWHQS
jgi:predicted RNase H-like HicB family nuclease